MLNTLLGDVVGLWQTSKTTYPNGMPNERPLLDGRRVYDTSLVLPNQSDIMKQAGPCCRLP